MKTITNLAFLLFISISFSQISLNEIDVDQTGTDITEFVELRSDTPNFSLEGYILVFYNGQDDESYRTVDLTGFATDAEGFFIIGSNATPGVDISIGTSNTIQNGPDAVAIYEDVASNFPNGTPVTNANLIDAIVYGTNDDDDAELLTGLDQTVQYDEDLNGSSETESIQSDGAGNFCVALPTLRATNTCALGIEDANLQTFKIFPNPATADFIEITSKMDASPVISIFDMRGLRVAHTTLTGNRLDISALNSGVYILKMEQENASVTQKLIVK